MRTRRSVRLLLLGLGVLGTGPRSGWSQRESDLPDAPSASMQQRPGGGRAIEAERKALEEQAEAEREVRAQEQQRILAVVPNFNTVISGRGVRLSKGQKTELALHATFDPYNAIGAAALAGVSELQGTHRGYGWGPGGYFKRVGAQGADVIVGTMLAGAAYPILLRQDPRFFRLGRGSVPARIRHALLSAVICRGDNQKLQPNYSNVLGNFSAGLISNAYYPAADRGIGLALVNSTAVTLEGAAGNIALEFSPDISAWWQRRRERKQP